jgi:hypothetical protein
VVWPLGKVGVTFGVVPSEYGANVGGGEVCELFAAKFLRDMPQNLVADRARDSDRTSAKAKFREVYGVLAKKEISHAHVGEAPPWERVGCG